METSSTAAPPVSGTEISFSPSLPQTTQVIPGTTVVGTGTTGDVWSYTIPDATTFFPISESASVSAAPNPPANTLVFTTVVVAGTTVTGGVETGVPWSYTIPAATFLSSVIVPVTRAPTQTSLFSETPTPTPTPTPTSASVSESQTPSDTATPTPSLTSLPSDSLISTSPTSLILSTPSTSSSSAVPSLPPADSPPRSDNSALSGGIVGAVLGALLLVILGIATLLCLRRRRRRLGKEPAEKSVGVIWGKGWGRDGKGRRAWRNARPAMVRGEDSGESSGLGSRTRLWADAQMVEAQEPYERPRPGDRRRIKYPYPVPTPDPPTPSQANSYAPDNPYASTSQHPQYQGSNPNIRNSTAPPPNQKPPRSVPPPTQYVYAPPPTPPPPPEPSPAPVPDLYRTASPPPLFQSAVINRPTSPHSHGSGTTSPVLRGPGPNRLSKQRITPSASAMLRHMVPTRGASLRRPRAGPSAPPPPSSSSSEQPTRPGISTLPSFIRERQFSPTQPVQRGGVASPSGHSQSALFSPRTSHTPLPHPHHNRSFATSRDGLLSPPHPSYPRDRYSQMTSTTRSGGTGWSGGTGRSGDSRYGRRSIDSRITGRSMDSRVTGRSGDSRLTGRSGGLGRVVEGQRGWEGSE
ncbi:hypothetical protein FRC12_011626 [Ceratobasidium sp. 428]|nr:hypothetical protein FRC12_011626 [Ceratobasidium sp. 428]